MDIREIFFAENESDWEPGQDGLFWFSFSFVTDVLYGMDGSC